MKSMQIGKSGIAAPRLAIGAFAMGGGTAWSDTVVDADAFVEVFLKAAERGANYIDTAPVYGTGVSEEIVGRALKGRRDRFILATKCSLQWRDERGVLEYERDGRRVHRCFEPDSLRQDLEDSLRRLGTDYIDFYITHRQPAIEAIPAVMDTLLTFKKEGKIRGIGISNATPEILEAYLRCGPVDLVQEHFSLLTREHAARYLPLCEREGVTFQTFRSLEEGVLSGKLTADYRAPAGDVRTGPKWFQPEHLPRALGMLDRLRPLCDKYHCSMAALIFAWTLAQSESLNLLVGIRRLETLYDTIAAVDLTLEPEDVAWMTAASDAIQ